MIQQKNLDDQPCPGSQNGNSTINCCHVDDFSPIILNIHASAVNHALTVDLKHEVEVNLSDKTEVWRTEPNIHERPLYG